MAGSTQGRRRAIGLLLAASLTGAVVPALVSSTGTVAGASAVRHHATTPRVTVSPLPGSMTADPTTQISIVGVPKSQIGKITVRGSKSGLHTGTLKAYSQGDGASYVLSTAFTPGEVVTVKTGLNVAGTTNGTWHFSVATPYQLPSATPQGAPTTRTTTSRVSPHDSTVHWVTQPNLHPPLLSVDVRDAGIAPGYVFVTPRGSIGQGGVEIVDNWGHPIWFDPVGTALDLKVQSYLGQPVLTYFTGRIYAGFGIGSDVILSSSYRQIAVIKGGNGLAADVHECVLEPNGAALITAYQPIYWNLTSIGGPSNAPMVDSAVQEIDVKTGLVRYQWDSLDHEPLTQSYQPYGSGFGSSIYDYFHINSIQPIGARTLIVSARNTHQIYDVGRPTGHVRWRLGGKNSTFTMGNDTHFAWQHDAELHPDGILTVFDDEGYPDVKPPSRGLVLKLYPATHRAYFDQALLRTPSAGTATSQGNVEDLPNGDRMVGWGSLPYATEFTSSGTEIWDLEFPGTDQSYRALRFPWSATPNTLPALVVKTTSSTTQDNAYMSWNGATTVASWRILGGSSSSTLTALVTRSKNGFENHQLVPVESYYEVQALDKAGNVIGTSAVVTPTS
jgi:hypothetical protein